MWYLVEMDEGIKEKAKTKRELSKFCKCTRDGRGCYEARSCIDGSFLGWIMKGEDTLIRNGFDWVLKEDK